MTNPKLERRLMIGRILYALGCALILGIGVFLLGMYSGAKHTFPYRWVSAKISEFESVLTYSDDLLGIKPTAWVTTRRYKGSGVTINQMGGASEDLVLLQGFFEGGLQIRLITREGDLINFWEVSFLDLVSESVHIKNFPSTDWNVGFHGSVINPDGSIVFNFDHVGLMKLDKCGRKIWHLDVPTHHSVELNSDGSYWVSSSLGVESNSPGSIYKFPYASDSIIRVASTGHVELELSLEEVFQLSSQTGLLTLNGNATPGALMNGSRPDYGQELFHLNDVEELPLEIAHKFPQFEPGDLLVSVRNRNLVLVIDPNEQLIKWWHIGPWIRQHDPDWNFNGYISLFDNHRDGTTDGSILGGSRILALDPVTKTSTVLYGGTENTFFYSERRGKHQILEDRGLMIVEAEAGRVFQIDPEGNLVWEYVNQYDENQNARITEARVYSADYFGDLQWYCPP